MTSVWNEHFTDFFANNRCHQDFKAHSSWVSDKQSALEAAADDFWSYTQFKSPNLCVALFNVTPEIRFMVYLSRHSLKLAFCNLTKKEMDRGFQLPANNPSISPPHWLNRQVMTQFDFMQTYTLSAHQITPIASRLHHLILDRTEDEQLV